MSNKVQVEITKEEAFLLLGVLARHVYDGHALSISNQEENEALRNLCQLLDDELVEQYRDEYKKFAQSRAKGKHHESI